MKKNMIELKNLIPVAVTGMVLVGVGTVDAYANDGEGAPSDSNNSSTSEQKKESAISTEIKEVNLVDVAYQKYILEKNNINIIKSETIFFDDKENIVNAARNINLNANTKNLAIN